MTEKTEEKSLLREVWDALSFSEIRTAMRVALTHMFIKPVTFQYPREKRTIPDAHRGALGLLRYDDGAERCVGCDLCEAACPSRCIKVVSAENPERPLSRYATEFYIDITKCVFCGYCVEACPTDAITHGHGFEVAAFNASDLVYRKEQMLAPVPAHIGANAVFNQDEVAAGAPAVVAPGE